MLGPAADLLGTISSSTSHPPQQDQSSLRKGRLLPTWEACRTMGEEEQKGYTSILPRAGENSAARLIRCRRLAVQGSFMDASDPVVDGKIKTLIRGLLNKAQPVPKNSLFREDLSNSTFRKMRSRNETRGGPRQFSVDCALCRNLCNI